MNLYNFSAVEQHYFSQSGRAEITTKIPYIVVPTFPNLGLFTALRFLEWVSENPKGLISHRSTLCISLARYQILRATRRGRGRLAR